MTNRNSGALRRRSDNACEIRASSSGSPPSSARISSRAAGPSPIPSSTSSCSVVAGCGRKRRRPALNRNVCRTTASNAAISPSQRPSQTRARASFFTGGSIATAGLRVLRGRAESNPAGRAAVPHENVDAVRLIADALDANPVYAVLPPAMLRHEIELPAAWPKHDRRFKAGLERCAIAAEQRRKSGQKPAQLRAATQREPALGAALALDSDVAAIDVGPLPVGFLDDARQPALRRVLENPRNDEIVLQQRRMMDLDERDRLRRIPRQQLQERIQVCRFSRAGRQRDQSAETGFNQARNHRS